MSFWVSQSVPGARPRLASVQAETFVGGYYASNRRGEVWHAVLSLVGTVVGGGSLSVPWAVDKAGFALGLGLLVIAAFFSAASVQFLLSAARRRGGLRTYDEVLCVAAGRWAQALTVFSVVFTTFLTLVANQILLRQLLQPLAHLASGRVLSHWEAVGLGSAAVALVIPLTFLPTLNSLRHVGLFSVTAVSTLVVVLAVRAARCKPSAHDTLAAAHSFDGPAHPSGAGPLAMVGSPWSVLVAVPVFVCVYLCSFSALPIDTEMRAPSRRRMNTFLTLAFAISLFQYLVLAICGVVYSRCIDAPLPSNLLLLFDESDVTATLMRALLSAVLLMSLPLICLPCRATTHQLVKLVLGVGHAPPVDDDACRTSIRASRASSSATISGGALPLPFMTNFGEASPVITPRNSASVGTIIANGLAVNVPACAWPRSPQQITAVPARSAAAGGGGLRARLLPEESAVGGGRGGGGVTRAGAADGATRSADAARGVGASDASAASAEACPFRRATRAGRERGQLHVRVSSPLSTSPALMRSVAAATAPAVPSLPQVPPPPEQPPAVAEPLPPSDASAPASAPTDADADADTDADTDAHLAPGECAASGVDRSRPVLAPILLRDDMVDAHAQAGDEAPDRASVDADPLAADKVGRAMGGAGGASSTPSRDLAAWERAVASLVIMLLSMALASIVDDVSVVWGFIGSTAAILLGLTFPCIAYISLRQTPINRPTSVPQRKAFAWFIVVVSVALIPACLVVATSEAISRGSLNATKTTAHGSY